MKLLTTVLLMMLSLSGYAGFKTEMRQPAEIKGSGNAIDINNNTKVDIAYVMRGVYGGAIYMIRAGGKDVYHSGLGDKYATFEVGTCKTAVGEACVIWESLNGCNNNAYYNADFIKSIVINSLDVSAPASCVITCLDGSDTSCKQSG